jgi:hypothetical protein
MDPPEKKFRQKSFRAGNSGAPHALAERRRPNTYQCRPYPVGLRLSQTQDVEAQSVSMPIFQAGRVAVVTESLANAAYDAAWMEAICFQACGPLVQKKVGSGTPAKLGAAHPAALMPRSPSNGDQLRTNLQANRQVAARRVANDPHPVPCKTDFTGGRCR